MGELDFRPRPFRPAPWARGPNAQTLGARVLRSGEGPYATSERLDTPDGDFLDLAWGSSPGTDAPVALVLHGLEGSAKRRYVRNVARELLRHGVQPVALSFRGCSGEVNRALHFYHSGQSSDPAFVLQELRRRFPGRPVGAIGFSLGGNVLLKMMGERADGGRALVDAAAAISVPYDLAAGCEMLESTTAGRGYAYYFLRSLRAKVALKRERLAGVLDVEHGLAARTIREFDERVTAPLNGFSGAAHYYDTCSSVRFFPGIDVPTLMLHARDDPFLPPDSIPVEAARRNAAVHLVVHDRGGHVGFLEGPPWRPSFWAEEEAARFVANRLLGTPGRAPERAAGQAERVP